LSVGVCRPAGCRPPDLKAPKEPPLSPYPRTRRVGLAHSQPPLSSRNDAPQSTSTSPYNPWLTDPAKTTKCRRTPELQPQLLLLLYYWAGETFSHQVPKTTQHSRITDLPIPARSTTTIPLLLMLSSRSIMHPQLDAFPNACYCSHHSQHLIPIALLRKKQIIKGK
jgi:hypothetical protein